MCAMQYRAESAPLTSLCGSSLVDLLRDRASRMEDRLAFSFLRGDGTEEMCFTYQGLHNRAMAIGGELQTLMSPGERALLLFPPGLDFIAAFFGCLYAGVVAVPAAIPSRHRLTSSVEAIFDASKPSFVLSTADHREHASRTYAHESRLLERPWLAIDEIDTARQHTWHDPEVGGSQIALLQYTSGSTSIPKGVMVSHENLLHNAALIQDAFGTNPQSSAVFWLPLYHDMGLIGGVIQPVYCGGSCTLLAPAAFLQRPALWLETISRTRATMAGGPDFAYDLCARKIPAEERALLDLSRWDLAFLGAEQIRPQTLDRFANAFAPCGFRREAFFPCYGLAESTLMVSGGPRRHPPVIIHVKTDPLARNEVEVVPSKEAFTRSLVGCGEGLPSQRCVIVDPATHRSVPEAQVGEIWVQGPSVARGYYESPQITAATFGAHLADNGDGPFLRTGDLGFVYDRQLFVTGRLKGLIIIRGRNHYPEDIEHTVDRSFPGLRVGHCAAFSVDVEDRDRLVIVQEIEPRSRDLDTDAAIRAIRSAVATRHELEVYAIVLAKAGSIPKTSSGKTRRAACCDRYLRDQLETLAVWTVPVDEGDIEASVPAPAARKVSAGEIESWLIERITARLNLQQAAVQVTTPFLELGMGSLDAVEIATSLEQWLGRRLSPTAIYNYPTIAALAQWLASAPRDEDVDVASQPIPWTPVEVDPERLQTEVQSMTEEEMEAFIALEMAKQEGK